MLNQRLITVNECAKHYNVSRITVRRLVKNKHLKCTRIGRAMRFRVYDVEQYMDRNQKQNNTSMETI